MLVTPWGDASELRSRQLIPGARTPAEEVARNQRERLFAALVAAVEENSYDGTRVEDLLDLSGVSRASFYERFVDKQDCLVQAARELTSRALACLENISFPSEPEVKPELRMRRALEHLVAVICRQPAAARLYFCDLNAGGTEALQVADQASERIAEMLGELLVSMPARAEIPEKLVLGIVGGYYKLIQSRVIRGEEDALPGMVDEMLDWGTSYVAPPSPLRAVRRRQGSGGPVAASVGEDPAERMLRALAEITAEKGYPTATVSGIAKRAAISNRTFYEHFEGREDAMMAAFDRGASEMVAAIMPAFRRARDWPEAVCLGLRAMFDYAAREPEYALLGVVGAYAVGKPALEARDRIMVGLEALLQPGFEIAPEAPKIAPEAIGGAINALTYKQLKSEGPDGLRQIWPLATYMALSPFIGPQSACEVANGGGRR
jgi:AcrR family transcriptional regulator